jgi:hypothetical protein
MRKPGYETAGQYLRPQVTETESETVQQDENPSSDVPKEKPKKKHAKKSSSDESVPY